MKEFDKKYFFWGGVELFLFLVLAASNVFADNLDKIFTLNTSFSTTLKFQWKAEVWLKCCRLTCSKNRHWWISKMITSSKNIIWVPEVGLCWESQSCIKSKTWGLDYKNYDRLLIGRPLIDWDKRQIFLLWINIREIKTFIHFIF